MTPLYVFVEEESCAILFRTLFSRLELDNRYSLAILSFQGKSDLEKKLIQRSRALPPLSGLMVLRDQDHEECRLVKARLAGKCLDAGRADAIIRILCRELESWYLGDLSAVEAAYKIGGISRRQSEDVFRNPDSATDPKGLLKQITRGRYQAISGTRLIGPHLSLSANRSPSFQTLIRSLEALK